MSEYGFTSDQTKPENTDYLEQKFKGHILRFLRET